MTGPHVSWRVIWLVLSAVLVQLSQPGLSLDANREGARRSDQLKEEFARLATRALDAKRPVVGARDGWLFLASDLRFSSLGPFWGDAAAALSRSRKPEHADPRSAIIDFHRQLADRGIELWLVPVPPKVALEGDRLASGIGDDLKVRCDGAMAPFLKELATAGVRVIDLEPVFRNSLLSTTGPLYCQTDSHWSGIGIGVAATAIAEVLKMQPWYADCAVTRFQRHSRRVAFTGDLTALEILTIEGFDRDRLPERESVDLSFVRTDPGDEPAPPSRSSAVLLLGDSHTLVFHDPTLYAAGAGLPDQLAFELGFPVDLIGVRGSGSTAARVTLVREKDRLTGKKAVIWCFAAREFTESTDGWRVLSLGKQ